MVVGKFILPNIKGLPDKCLNQNVVKLVVYPEYFEPIEFIVSNMIQDDYVCPRQECLSHFQYGWRSLDGSTLSYCHVFVEICFSVNIKRLDFYDENGLCDSYDVTMGIIATEEQHKEMLVTVNERFYVKIHDLLIKRGYTLETFDCVSGYDLRCLLYDEQGNYKTPTLDVCYWIAYCLQVDIKELVI